MGGMCVSKFFFFFLYIRTLLFLVIYFPKCLPENPSSLSRSLPEPILCLCEVRLPWASVGAAEFLVTSWSGLPVIPVGGGYPASPEIQIAQAAPACLLGFPRAGSFPLPPGMCCPRRRRREGAANRQWYSRAWWSLALQYL